MSTHCQRGIQSDARHFVTFAFCTLLFLFSYDFFHLLLYTLRTTLTPELDVSAFV